MQWLTRLFHVLVAAVWKLPPSCPPTFFSCHTSCMDSCYLPLLLNSLPSCFLASLFLFLFPGFISSQPFFLAFFVPFFPTFHGSHSALPHFKTYLLNAVSTWRTDCDSFHSSTRLPKRPAEELVQRERRTETPQRPCHSVCNGHLCVSNLCK